MDVLLGLGAFVVLLSVPTLLGLIYLELRQRRMFGPRSIITTDASSTAVNETAAIAMSLQAELERLRSDVHGALSAVSTDIERVRDHLENGEMARLAVPQPVVAESTRIPAERTAALAELYGALSKLDIAFLAVARPVLLPGETFDLEDELPVEAFQWESWNDVGTAAYHFAEVFSEQRIRLDAETRDRLNATVGAIRRCMTAQLYPLLTDLDGSIPDEHRGAVAQVVSALAGDIRDARDTLERASVG